jgi:hypothetical protein
MASKPKGSPPGAYPPDPLTWRPPPAPSAMLAARRHFVKATVCGQARRGHGMTTDWNEVNCDACLAAAPFRRHRSR